MAFLSSGMAVDDMPNVTEPPRDGMSIHEVKYRETIQNGKNLPLTQFRHLWQLMGRSCSYLLPRQDGGITQNYVNGRFLPF